MDDLREIFCRTLYQNFTIQKKERCYFTAHEKQTGLTSTPNSPSLISYVAKSTIGKRDDLVVSSFMMVLRHCESRIYRLKKRYQLAVTDMRTLDREGYDHPVVYILTLHSSNSTLGLALLLLIELNSYSLAPISLRPFLAEAEATSYQATDFLQ